MSSRVVLVVPEPQYAAKLARYLKEANPEWEVAAFTQETALRRHLAEFAGAETLLVHSSLLHLVRADSGKRRKLVVLKDQDSRRIGKEAEEAGEPELAVAGELAQFQPLPELVAKLREYVEGTGDRNAGFGGGGPEVWTVFSAAGGAGKTTVALNVVRQAAERGRRAFYLNLEPLNSTDLLFGEGEPDALSRLLYSLQNRPEKGGEEWEKLRRRNSRLQAEYLDAPEMPSERLAMTPGRLEELLALVRESGRYDLIVVDPDSGCGDWHRRLLELSDRVVWLTVDDALSARKSEKLARHWQETLEAAAGRVCFVLNKLAGAGANRWGLPGDGPAASIPYIPQWKSLEQPGRLFQAPSFSGAIDALLDGFGLAAAEEEPAIGGEGGAAPSLNESGRPAREAAGRDSSVRRGGAHARARTEAGRTG